MFRTSRRSVPPRDEVKLLPPRDRLLQIPLWLLRNIQQGEINLRAGGTEALRLKIESKEINLNFLRKEPLRSLLELETQLEKESIIKKMRSLKSIAEILKRDGLTMTISHRDRPVLTLGLQANPKLSRLITETSAIQINSLSRLLDLAK